VYRLGARLDSILPAFPHGSGSTVVNPLNETSVQSADRQPCLTPPFCRVAPLFALVVSVDGGETSSSPAVIGDAGAALSLIVCWRVDFAGRDEPFGQ